jgi:hypothetical protein
VSGTKQAAMRKPTAATRSTRGTLRSLIGALVLVTFTVQGFLIQTHIHALPQAPVTSAGGPSVAAPPDTKAPLDADKCLLCQEYLHGGSYVPPAAIAALPPDAVASLLPFVLALPVAARIVSHNWMGRAPPRA